MTFSIVARDPATGALGVATATAGPVVGALVPHVVAGVGAVATQAMTNPYLAYDSLSRLEELGAEGAVEAALALDAERNRRQVILIDAKGHTAAWTGPGCEGFAGHATAGNVAVAGNIIAGEGVLAAMIGAFEGGSGAFAERLVDAMVAGERAGGDRRGVQSAALKVFRSERFADIDLRVDWSAAPIEDLRSLLERTTRGTYAEFFAAVPRRGQD